MAARILLPLLICLATASAAQQAGDRQRRLGEPFQTVFPISGMGDQWWMAEYDHPADQFRTAWRKSGVEIATDGLRFSLEPTMPDKIVDGSVLAADDGTLIADGVTTKPFTSGQVQRRRWYGYGRYEVVMQPAAGEGLITAFYVYTGPYFDDPHEEIDIEFLGRDTNRVYLNRFRDGQPLADPAWIDLGFDSTAKPRLYGFEWRQDALIWFAGETELFRITDPDQIPRPPAKIYLDLWTGGKGQANWSGMAAPDATGEALFQCASYSPPHRETPQCSDLVSEE